MSKIAQIEAELSTKEGGIFQRICNYYLFRKYDISPTESGGAKGKDKTKPGTPDSFMVLQNGNFIFVEHSTGEKGLYSKFKEDLEEKCFNEEKTEVPISKIEKVILCYNTKLSPSDTSKLVEICKNRKVEIIFLDLNKLSNEIFSYPRLSQGLLDIETDTEQILKPLDFTEELEHQGTSQTNQFVGRMTEQKDLGLALESEDLIIVSGKAGLGKTRLITEVMNDFKRKNNDYEIYCIKTKSQPIYNDLKAYFLPSRSYIVLVDDANRIGELSNIFHLIRDKRFNIKMIVTVRDYALNKIKAILEQEKYPYFPFILKPLNYEAIREILLSLKINTRSCVDKIVEIANGNPRLVLMSADFVLENGDCRNLKDVTDIYNSFYGHFLTREDFKSREFLTTLGIICFFRSFGKNKNEFDQNNDFNQKVYSIFNISEAEFWKQMQILHGEHGMAISRFSDKP